MRAPLEKKQPPRKKGPWPTAEQAIGAILAGDWYANARLHFITRILTLLVIGLSLSLMANLALLPNPPKYRYVPVSVQGTVLPQVPLARPNHDEKFVVDWTIDAVTRLFSFDFMNYRHQLQDAQQNLTTAGWESFQKLMKESNNFNAIMKNRFVLTAVPTGAGKVTATAIVDGNYMWRVEFPMTISYRSSGDPKSSTPEGRVITDSLKMTVTVSRVGVFLNHTGLGIKSIIAER